jgi:magnesium-protoporphyrin O-methyltransferase
VETPKINLKGENIMDCCQCQGIEIKFDQEYVAKKLKKYRENGPKKTTRQLIKALQAEDIHGMTLLDIGSGIGDVQHELLKTGVSESMNNEASMAYVEACKAEAERQGYSERVHHYHGDFVDIVDDIPPTDIVTLDRVICCYHDMPGLVNLSAKKAKKFYGVVYPREKWWVKLGILIYYNLRHWLQRNPFRIYVHPNEAIRAAIRSNGLERSFYREMGQWLVEVYTRS